MRFGSLFSGIGGIDLGLERVGMECKWQVEIDHYRRKWLERHWPDVPKFNDVKEVGKHDLEPVDLICGGFPCQDVSVAGRRAGLRGERTGLFFEFVRILDEIRPAWMLLENVPGLFSSNGGRDFAEILRVLMVKCGYGVSWRVLDSKFFGVPQRRRRIYLVGYFGKPCPPEILFESESSKGDFEEGRETGRETTGVLGTGSSSRRLDLDGQHVAGTLGGGSGKRGWRDDFERAGAFVTDPLTSKPYADNEAQHNKLIAFHHQASAKQSMNPSTFSPALDKSKEVAVAYSLRSHPGAGQGDNTNYVAAPLSHGSNPMSVRRLTPIECARLQGFPDDWLGDNEPPDGPKYAAFGDAVTVTVAEWIGRRILEFDRGLADLTG